ncbi:MAG: hypothetical protein ACK578_25615, partial [Pirellula sp.]
MGFSTGGYNFELAALSKKATRGKTTSDTFVYVGTNGGSVDPAAAASAVLAYYRATQRDLIPFLQVDGEYINEKHALVTASINKTKLDPVSFNTTGASTHLNQSLFTRGIYAAPGKIAPNYRGAIGVSDSGVSGVDVTYHFAARPNEVNLRVGNINGVAKRGWDYLWVKHGEEVVGYRVLQVPE